MMNSIKTVVLLMGLLVLNGGCSTEDGTPELVCEPGKTSECMCSPNSPGIQVCKEDGSGWGKCENCETGPCIPDCEGKECGSDGCGDDCGQCQFPTSCAPDSGICIESCTPADYKCVGQEIWTCAPSEEWEFASKCPADKVCFEGSCCAPYCSGLECGDDGCGGSCGDCGDDESCKDGECVSTGPCEPDCTGLECGDDGCGGSCGDCEDNEECKVGTCKSTGPVCDCGDGTCESACPGETTCDCPEDCGVDCGDGCCHETENPELCPADCQGCGDGTCQNNEDCIKCPADCTCEAGEKCSSGECITCSAWCQIGSYECGSKGGCDCGGCGQNEKCETNKCVDDCDAICLNKDCGEIPGTDCDCGNCTGCKNTCDNHQCEATQNDHKGCDGDEIYWFDSCDEKGQFVETCEYGCAGGQCLEPGCDVICTPGTCGNVQDCPCGDCAWGEKCVANQCQPDCDVLCQGKDCGEIEETNCDCGACDDGLICTSDNCSNGKCQSALQSNYCLINSDCVGSGLENQQEPCLQCKPTIDKYSWTELEAGTPCGAGKNCYQGSCCDYEANCSGKECGNDGCGGVCGTCDGPQDECVNDKCECQPDCNGKECGDDGCGGQCGSCVDQSTCIGGECVCQPDCDGKECGDDGCAGTCGTCIPGWQCSESQQCLWPEDGTWADPDSGWVWQVETTGGKMQWASAKTHCAYLDLAGHSDWRLPHIGELRSLIRGCPATELGSSTCNVQEGGCLESTCNEGSSCEDCSYMKGPDYGCYWPDKMQGECSWYWSSSEVVDNAGLAWYVAFPYGLVGHYLTPITASKGLRVRCVR